MLRSNDSKAKLRLRRLEKNLKEGKYNIHLKVYTPGAAQLLQQYGRQDIFCPLPGRNKIHEKTARRRKIYERSILRERGEKYSRQFRSSKLASFLRD